MKTHFCDNTFYIEGGEASQGSPIIIPLSYIKDCVKSLKTLGFKNITVFAKFTYLENDLEETFFKLYGGRYYYDYLELELNTRTVTHKYQNTTINFSINKDNSYEYKGEWNYYYLNRVTNVKIKFY